MLIQNKQIFKSNDSNNCSFEDADVEGMIEMVQEEIQNCEPDKLAKQQRNKEILEERKILMSRKQFILENPPQQKNELSIDDQIQQLLKQHEFESLDAVYEELDYANERIEQFATRPAQLQRAKNDKEKCNNFLQKHAQLVQPKIQNLLDDLELNNIEDAIAERESQQTRLNRLPATSTQNRQKCIDKIAQIDKILKIVGRPIQQPDEDDGRKNEFNPPEEDKEDDKIKKDKVQQPIPNIDVESLFQREKEDAENQAAFIKLAPDSFEKSVRILTHILYQIIHGDLKPSDTFLNVPTSKYHDLIENHLINIKQTYIGEIIKNNEIYMRVNQIEDQNGTKEQFLKILDSLKQIQPLIQKFSFQEFFSYIKKANEVADKITNTDIVLLLGTSGAGKSTTIHYICGSQMIETEQNDLKHIAFGKVTNPDLLNVKVSPYSRSETRYIRPIKINVESSFQETITLVDSPGLFDLKNAEVDVSNQIGIIKALSSVRSVKPFIVLSYKKIGARGENLKEILTFYSQMVVDSGYLDYFNFFFSHVDRNVTIQNLTARIKDILKQLNTKEQQNERLVHFLKVIIKKAEQEKLFIINPLDSQKIQTILSDINSTSKIPFPSSVFQKAVCEESKNKIIEQFDLHSRQIQSSFKKAQAEKVDFMLTELQQFCDIMDTDQEYKVRLNEILRKLNLKMNEKYNEVISVFKKQLQPGNNIGEPEVGLYQSNILFMYHLEDVRKKFLCEIDGNQIITYSYQNIEQEVERLIKNTFDLINSPQVAKLDSQNLHDFLQKLDILSSQKEKNFIRIRDEIFEKIYINLKEIPKRAIQFLETVMKSLDQDFLSDLMLKKSLSKQQQSPVLQNEEIKNNEMEEEQKPSQLINQFCKILGELERAEVISKDLLKSKVGEIIKQIAKNLKDKFDKLIQIYFEDFQKMNLENINNISNLEEDELNSLIFTMTKERVSSIQKYYQLLDCFTRSMNSFDLSQSLIDFIEAKQSKMNQQLNYWCTVQEVKFKRKITQSKKYSAIKSIYDELMLAQSLPSLQGQTSRQNRIKMNLTKLVSDKSEEAKKHMSTIEKIVNNQQVEDGKQNNNQQISMYTLVSLKDAISTIKDLQWTVENGNEDLYDDLKKELQTNLDKLVIQIEESVKFSREKQTSASDIADTENAFKQISEIQKIANIIDIKLQDINIDEFMPDIEYNLNNIEIFLAKKGLILFEEQSKKDQVIVDQLLRKSECEKFSKYFNYLNILNKKDFMIKKIDEIAEKKGQKQKSFSSRINKLTEALNEFLNKQMDKVRSEFTTQLNLMKQYLKQIQTLKVNEDGFYEKKEHEEQANQFLDDFLVNPVERIINIFKMIRELKGKYQAVWKKLSPNDDAEEEDFRQPLEKFYREVNKDIALARNNQVQVTNNLQIINQLIPLDMYMHEQNDGKRNRVQEQYDKHFQELINFNENVVKTVQEFLATQNYEEIKTTLITLQQLDKMDKQQNFRKVQQLVHQKCNLLSQSISKESRNLIQGKQLDPEITEKLNQKSIELQEILDIIGDKLIDENIYKRAKRDLQNAQSKMASNFKELQRLIDNQIQRSNFNEAYDSILIYNQSAKNADFGQASSADHEEIKDDSNNYLSQTEKLKQKLDQAIRDKVEEFKQLQIKSQTNSEDDLILDMIIKNSAREIIENLESNNKDPEFKIFAKQIKDSIIEIFETKLQKVSAKVGVNCNDSELLSQQIRNCLNFCTKLPQEMNQKYVQSVKDLQKKFEDQQAKESSEILEFMKDSKNTLEQVFTRITQAIYSLNNECRIELNQLYLSKIKNTIKQIKDQSLTSEIQFKLREFWLFQSTDSIKKYLDQQSNGQYSTLQRVILSIYNYIIKRTAAIFVGKEHQIVFPIKIDDKEYPFNINQLTWYTELSEKYPNLADEMIPNYEENLINLLETGMEQIKKHQSEFQSKITSNDPVILTEIFTIIVYMRHIFPAQDLIYSLSTDNDAVDNFGRPIKKREQSLLYVKKHEEFVKLAEVADKKQFCSQLAPKFKMIEGEVMKSQFINTETQGNDHQRKKYYDKLEKQFNFIQQSQQIQQDLVEVQIDAIKVKTDCEKKFQANYKEIEEQAVNLTNKLQGLKTADFKSLNQNLENLKLIQETFKNQVPSNFVQIKQKATNMIIQQTQQIKNDLLNKNVKSKDITDQLIISQDIATNITELCDCAQGSIQDILDTLQKNSEDQSNISEIALLLKKSPVGSIIIEKQPIFICEQRTFWAKKIEHQEIGYVLDNLMKGDGKTKISAKEKQTLKQLYDLYQDKYKNLVENNIVPFENIPKNKEQLKINLLELTQKSKQNKIDIIAKNFLPEILANLFAIWTISDFYGNKLKCTDMSKANSIPYLLKPHPSQVISILRILGHGYENIVLQDQNKLNPLKKDQISNFLSTNQIVFDNLVQIKTGEGKSITLAIVISVFALWDFEVSCACYSQYLSVRDFLSFKDLFQFLNINEKIFYGTFNQICERYINKDGDIRNLVLNRILKDSQLNVKPLPLVKKRVILIDEVDVFFSKDFYNKVYVPVAQIKHEKVSKLLDFMWENKDDKSFTLKKIKSSQQYIQCETIFKPEFVGILEEACKDMYSAAQNFLKHDYVVQNNMIGYQEMDQISFTKSYGYNTIFAHYHHLQTPKNNQKVSQQSLDNCKGIEIYCGQFSYAEIPLYSMLILGVTGTLDSLTESENKIIQDVFQIKNFTYSPSVYGTNKLQWAELNPNHRLLIYNSLEYYNELTNQIKSKMKGDNCQRAVLVFFKTLDLLKEFKESNQYINLKCEKQELSELCDEKEKESIIIQATYQNTLTLTTRSFGRGTDFICRDELVEKNGGVHVILTFVPELHSEFVQIQGRTARQGNNGSFQMILLDTDLQQIDVDVETQEFKQQYDKKLEYIFQQRDKMMLKTQQSDTKAVEQIRAIHQQALEFKDNLMKNDATHSAKVAKYLININAGPSMKEDEFPVKTLILMDATGSMSSLLVEAKNSVNQMYERAGKILEQNRLDPHLNQIQYACYRNYSSGTQILQNSPWESKAEKLKAFMDSIGVSGGMGNEAVEIGFQHAVSEAQNCNNIPLRQVYLIGDMPPNTKQEVDSRRSSYQFWRGTKFETPAYWDNELAKLKQLNVKVHTFYLNNGTVKPSFEDIAQRTGGESCFLDVSKPNSQDILLNLFIPNILKMIGEANGDVKLGQKMVAEYMNCYK